MVATDLLKRWLLAAPRTIERTNQRLVARHLVAGIPDFALSAKLASGTRDVAMRDISNAGLSFSVASGDAPIAGGIVSGRLEVPGLQPLGLTMEVRHRRPMPGDSTRSLIGVKFMDLAHAERTALARALAAWHHDRRHS